MHPAEIMAAHFSIITDFPSSDTLPDWLRGRNGVEVDFGSGPHSPDRTYEEPLGFYVDGVRLTGYAASLVMEHLELWLRNTFIYPTS
jgi:hypothetical protein